MIQINIKKYYVNHEITYTYFKNNFFKEKI